MDERPTDLSAKQLRFQRLPAVRWLSTRVLSGTAVRLVMARVLGAFLDKRELQAYAQQGVFDHSSGDELWLDYVADIGDGFNSTYSIAYLMSQAELIPAAAPNGSTTTPLPRGNILVMGGDQVYPAANWRDYENRCKGPYQAALPKGDGALYAIPGNHDWFDGLTAFLRLFGAERDIGGRSTYQRRSYWAARLPHRWWLVGIDAQFDAYLDTPQLQYFTEAFEQMEPGDPVILCVPRPAWTWTEADPRAFDRVDYFIRTFIEPRGGRVPLILTGDRHHYVHYEEVDGERHLITAGGGGAYLSGTHTMPARLEAPPPESMARHGSATRSYKRGAAFPDRRKSWQQALKIFWRMPIRNPSFSVLLGVIHMLGLLSFVQGAGPAVAAVVGTVAITVAFANPSAGARTLKYWVAALLHAAAHLAVTTLAYLTWQWFHLESIGVEPYLVFVPIGGAIATVVVSAYLVVASAFGINDNELFAGQSIEDYKCFLRLRISRDGATVFPIAVPKVSRRWRANPQGGEEDSWVVPETPIRTHFIEEPYTAPGKHLSGDE
ncbi:MAG: metallophosphoesterase family protein [Stackebrandtia sp.]